MKPEPSFISQNILQAFDAYAVPRVGKHVLPVFFQFVQYGGISPKGPFTWCFIFPLN